MLPPSIEPKKLDGKSRYSEKLFENVEFGLVANVRLSARKIHGNHAIHSFAILKKAQQGR